MGSPSSRILCGLTSLPLNAALTWLPPEGPHPAAVWGGGIHGCTVMAPIPQVALWASHEVGAQRDLMRAHWLGLDACCGASLWG